MARWISRRLRSPQCPGRQGASLDKTSPSSPTAYSTEQPREADDSLRVLYSARILACRACSLRQQCQWHEDASTKPRRISLLLHPLQVGPIPLLWRDWSRRKHRRTCQHLLRDQRVEVNIPSPLPPIEARPINADVIFSRAQQAHARLSWETRPARNARPETAGQITIKLFGVPNDFARLLGLAAG